MLTTHELGNLIAGSNDVQAPQVATHTDAVAINSNHASCLARRLRLQRECDVSAVPAVLLAVACLALIVAWSLSGIETDATLARAAAAQPNTMQSRP